MTNDEAGNRVMTFMAEMLTAFMDVSKSKTMSEDSTPQAQMAGISTLINNAIMELTSGELGKAMEILIDARKPTPKLIRNGDGIAGWVHDVIEGVGGLKSFHRHELGGSRAGHLDVGKWIIRCLANTRCEGAGAVVNAILVERMRKLGLPEEDLARVQLNDLLKDHL